MGADLRFAVPGLAKTNFADVGFAGVDGAGMARHVTGMGEDIKPPPVSPAVFSSEEVERYARHLVLREVGGPGQQRLKAARVLLVGAGGLGAPAALYLAAAGVGAIRIADPDVVSLSNLQRQVLYSADDLEAPKVAVAQARLASMNPHVTVEPIERAFTAETGAALIDGCDLVLDGTDDFVTRFAVNAACVQAGVPLVSGALGRWTGQIGVFDGRPLLPLPRAGHAARGRDLRRRGRGRGAGRRHRLDDGPGGDQASDARRGPTDRAPPNLRWTGGGSRTVSVGADPACPVCAHAAPP